MIRQLHNFVTASEVAEGSARQTQSLKGITTYATYEHGLKKQLRVPTTGVRGGAVC